MALILGLGDSPPFESGDTARGIAFVSIYIATFSIFQFTLGDFLIANEIKENSRLSMPSYLVVKTEEEEEETDQRATQEPSTIINQHKEEEKSNTPKGTDDAVELLTKGEEKEKNKEESTEVPKIRFLSERRRKRTLKEKIIAKLKSARQLATPPNISLLLGLVIALISPVRGWLVSSDPDKRAPLSFFMDTLKIIGAVNVPMGIVNVGAALSRLSIKPQISFKVIFSIFSIKFFLMPAVGISLIYLMTYVAHVIPSDDKMFLFVIICWITAIDADNVRTHNTY